MVRLIKKMLWALIKKCKIIFCAMVLVSSCGVTLGVGFLSSYNNFVLNVDTFFNEYGFPDITLTLDYLYYDKDVTDAIKDIPCTFNTRFEYNFSAIINNQAATLDIRTISQNSFIKLYVYEHVEPREDIINIKIHQTFAKNNNIKAGDIISLGIAKGSDTIQAHVDSIVSSTETICYAFNAKIEVDQFGFGYAFISSEELHKYLPHPFIDCVNQIIVKTDKNHSEIETKIKDALLTKNIYTIDSFTRENSPTTILFGYLNRQLKVICYTVPIVFLIITFTLVFLFLLQITSNFLREIGILQALGIGKKQIVGLIIAFSLVMGISSSLIGCGFSYLLTQFITSRCAHIFSIPAFNILSLPLILLIMSLILISLSVLAALTTMFVVRRISPKDAINNNASQFKPLPKRIEKFIKKRGFVTKININNIHKNFLRCTISVLTFACAYILIFGSVNFYCANDYLVYQMHTRFNYQSEIYSVDIFSPDNIIDREYFVNNVSNLSAVKTSTPLLSSALSLSFNGQSELITVCGIPSNHSLVHIPDFHDNECSIKPGCIVLDNTLANSFNIKIDDVVELNGCPLVVSNISNLCSKKYHYVEYNTLLYNVKPNVVIDYVAVQTNNVPLFLTQLSEIPELNYYHIFINNYYSSLNGVYLVQTGVVILIIFSFVIGLLVIFITNLENVESQKRKFSILCALGYRRKQIANVILSQSIINFILGIIIAIPCGIGFAYLIVKIASNSISSIIFINYWWIYLLASGIPALYLICVFLYSYYTIKRWKINDNIKSRE